MRNFHQFYINGAWVDPVGDAPLLNVINPATEQVAGTIRLATIDDIEGAVHAAHQAFSSYGQTSLATRLDLLASICSEYEKCLDYLAEAITEEMGAPLHNLARPLQAPIGLWHFQKTLAAAREFSFEKAQGSTLLVREPIGVCALVTPWNWPLNQIACKVAPALAAGCAVVLKPSELAPFSAQIFAEIMHAAGVPAGVFNMLYGNGEEIGPYMSAHPLVDMVSLTGSNRAGASVAHYAAETSKKVSLELGGKSANIILPDADLRQAVTHGVQTMMVMNAGQSCNAPSRMLVPINSLDEVEAIAAEVCSQLVVGDPRAQATTMGPIANQRQFQRVQSLIETGIKDGAKLVAGGPGRPEGITQGYFVRPTVFSRANNKMSIAREEIFGPVLTIIPYSNEDEAVAIANDSIYGLSGYVFGATVDHARAVAKRLRTGMVHLNGAPLDFAAPFGGYKQSGVGREWGVAGLEEFLELKAIMGSQAVS